jgi:hypothetical protein
MTFTPTWNERDTFRVLPVEATLTEQTESALTDALQASLDRTTQYILSAGAADLGVTRAP